MPRTAAILERLQKALADRYVVERELSRGGMAIIYLAEERKHHRQVALKVLQPQLTMTLGPLRFLREIEIAAHLTHPHILPLHDSGDADGLLYYVMPYVAGETLRQRLGHTRRVPVADVIHLLRHILDALSYAHARGVIHRDIKPENVLIAGRNALVIDFGVAKAVSLAAALQGGRPTQGMVVGTPEYVSPEQAASNPAIDHRTDVYAIGAMTYELLTGQPPFTDKDPQRVLAAQIYRQPRPVAQLCHLPPGMAELVMRALAKEPAERWQSADEMISQLDSLPDPVRGPAAGPPAGAAPAPPAAIPDAQDHSSTPWKGILALAVIGAAVLALLATAVLVYIRPLGS